MKPLKNWDNRTWLSSKKYIDQFHKFLKKKVKAENPKRVAKVYNYERYAKSPFGCEKRGFKTKILYFRTFICFAGFDYL